MFNVWSMSYNLTAIRYKQNELKKNSETVAEVECLSYITYSHLYLFALVLLQCIL